MRLWKRRVGAAMLTLAGVLAADAGMPRGAAQPAPTRFPALDGGASVVPHVLVTALAVSTG